MPILMIPPGRPGAGTAGVLAIGARPGPASGQSESRSAGGPARRRPSPGRHGDGASDATGRPGRHSQVLEPDSEATTGGPGPGVTPRSRRPVSLSLRPPRGPGPGLPAPRPPRLTESRCQSH